MSCEQKFNAAVNVIRNLPKNGSYQPAPILMLKFYAYYKQATEGPAKGGRPGFWDIVKRAKWDAWAALGNMSKEEAMISYVEELNKIVETMALTENVADFLTSLDTYSGSVEDLEMCIGSTLDKVRSQPGSPLSNTPLGSRDASPIRSQTCPLIQIDQDDDEDDFLDSIEHAESIDKSLNNNKSFKEMEIDKQHLWPNNRVTSKQITQTEKIPNGFINDQRKMTPHHQDKVSEVLQRAIESLRRDLTSLADKTRILEERQKKVYKGTKLFLGNMSGQTVAFIILWPIFINYMLNWLRNKKFLTKS